MTARDWLVRAADSVGATRALLAIRAVGPPRWLTVVTWHRIDEPSSADDVDDGVLDATPAEFAAQVDVLQRHFHVVRLADVERALEGGALPPNPALLTFDDGYRDSYHHALPVMRRAGVPATFFIATTPINLRVPFWWDAVSWILKHATRQRVELRQHAILSADVARDGTASVTAACLAIVKRAPGLDVDGFLRELADASGAVWDEATSHSIANRLLMTWDEIRGLERAGMEIGSHTRTHRVLDTIPEHELEGELTGAREDLAKELGHAPMALAYPVGKPVSHVPAIRRAVERAGYTMAFTYLTGFQPLNGPADRFSIRRIAMDRNTTPARFRSRLATVGLLG